MQLYSLESSDYALIDAAYRALRATHVPDKRFIVAAARVDDTIYTATNVRAYLGRASVCAEPMVLAKALDAGSCFSTIAVVCFPESIVTPCGACRELLSDYCPDAFIIMQMNGELKKCRIKDLLPCKFFGLPKKAFAPDEVSPS